MGGMGGELGPFPSSLPGWAQEPPNCSAGVHLASIHLASAVRTKHSPWCGQKDLLKSKPSWVISQPTPSKSFLSPSGESQNARHFLRALPRTPSPVHGPHSPCAPTVWQPSLAFSCLRDFARTVHLSMDTVPPTSHFVHTFAQV